MKKDIEEINDKILSKRKMKQLKKFENKIKIAEQNLGESKIDQIAGILPLNMTFKNYKGEFDYTYEQINKKIIPSLYLKDEIFICGNDRFVVECKDC
jgi:hypothetical protein